MLPFVAYSNGSSCAALSLRDGSYNVDLCPWFPSRLMPYDPSDPLVPCMIQLSLMLPKRD